MLSFVTSNKAGILLYRDKDECFPYHRFNILELFLILINKWQGRIIMAINYGTHAKQIVELIGGDSNVISVTHRATRLRFVLKEMGRVDKEVLKRGKGSSPSSSPAVSCRW